MPSIRSDSTPPRDSATIEPGKKKHKIAADHAPASVPITFFARKKTTTAVMQEAMKFITCAATRLLPKKKKSPAKGKTKPGLRNIVRLVSGDRRYPLPDIIFQASRS